MPVRRDGNPRNMEVLPPPALWADTPETRRIPFELAILQIGISSPGGEEFQLDNQR